MVGASLDNITGDDSSALVDLKLQLKKATKNREKEIQWQCPLEAGSCDVTVNIVYVTEDDKELVVMLNHQQVASQPISPHQVDSQKAGSQQALEENLSSKSTDVVPPSSKPSSPTDKLPSIFPKSYSADSVPSFTDTPFVGSSGVTQDPGARSYGEEQDGFEPIENHSKPGSDGAQKLEPQKPEFKDFNSFTNPVPGSDLANAIKPGISPDFIAQSESGALQELDESTEGIKPWDKAGRDHYFDGQTNLPNRQMLSQTISSFLEGQKISRFVVL